MIPTDELFVERLHQLARGVHQQDSLDVLPVAAALRQLLLDESPLVHQVNRLARVRLRFRVNKQPDNTPGVPEPAISFPGHGMDPNTVQFQTGTQELTLDEFLRHPVVTTKWGDVSVHELIDYLCHKAGAVHHDTKRSSEDVGLETVFAAMDQFGLQPMVIAMEAIARDVLVALAPLRDAVWRPPAELPLFSHYRQLPGGKLWVPGDGRYLSTGLSYSLKQGFTFAAALDLMPSGGEGERYLYELGVPGQKAPRLSLVHQSPSSLSFRFRATEEHELSIGLPPQAVRVFQERGAVLIAEAQFEPSDVTLTLSVGAVRVMRESMKAVIDAQPLTLQTLGASLEGTGHLAASIGELVLVERPLTDVERAALARYLGISQRAA